MERLFTKVADGSDPNGRWFAGDANALQDAVAALVDYTQNFGAGTVAIGDSGILIVKYGTGEARLTAKMRVDGILRALSGLVAGTFSTTARDAIGSGLAPYGLIVLNTTTNQYEWNQGTDGSRSWKPFGFDPAADLALIGGSSSLDFTEQTASNFFLTAQRASDGVARFAIREDGRMEWGPGSGARDTVLARSAAGVLQLGGQSLVVTNDSRIPTQDENDALAGSYGAPDSGNKFITATDPKFGRYAAYVNSVLGPTDASNKTMLDTTVKGGDLGATGQLYLELVGHISSKATSHPQLTVAVKFGGTTFVAQVWPTFNGSNTSDSEWKLDFWILNRDATHQNWNYRTAASGYGANDNKQGHGTGTIDTAADQHIVVTAQFAGSADAANTFSIDQGTLTIR